MSRFQLFKTVYICGHISCGSVLYLVKEVGSFKGPQEKVIRRRGGMRSSRSPGRDKVKNSGVYPKRTKTPIQKLGVVVKRFPPGTWSSEL